MTTIWRLNQPTREFVGPLTVTVRGDDGTITPWTDFQIAVTPFGTEPPAPEETPAAWETPETLDGDQGVLIGYNTTHALARGRWSIAANPLGTTPENVVIEEVGIVVIS